MDNTFNFDFNTPQVIEETGNPAQSSSPYWWVNSGARMLIGRQGFTVTGELLANDPWRILYNQNNPVDTDNGYHPQNIFRFVSRNLWLNARHEVSFNIIDDNLSASTNRNASNGLLLFNRYLNGNNLYYTGIRVDGAAVIKKKKNGIYYTMAYNTGLYPGVYNRTTNPNLIPHDTWITLRGVTRNLGNGQVGVYLYKQISKNNWDLIAEAVDNGVSYGGAAILEAGYTGIRTDFMDVAFDNWKTFQFSPNVPGVILGPARPINPFSPTSPPG